jgi:hypothetical protein
MPDPTGRWLNTTQWQCPKCAWVNDADRERCQKCEGSVRPAEDEPPRPPDPLDLVSHGGTPGASPAELVAKAIRVTREKARSVIGESLRTALKNRGEKGDRAWQAIAEMPASDQSAALDSVVDDLERRGFVILKIDGDEPG